MPEVSAFRPQETSPPGRHVRVCLTVPYLSEHGICRPPFPLGGEPVGERNAASFPSGCRRGRDPPSGNFSLPAQRGTNLPPSLSSGAASSTSGSAAAAHRVAAESKPALLLHGRTLSSSAASHGADDSPERRSRQDAVMYLSAGVGGPAQR